MLRRISQLFHRNKRSSLKTKTTKRAITRSQSYPGVEIKPALNGACTAVSQLAGVRYLSDEAPRLKLNECNATVCECRYIHFDDRRQTLRRDADYGIARPFTFGKERRDSISGRRAADAA